MAELRAPYRSESTADAFVPPAVALDRIVISYTQA